MTEGGGWIMEGWRVEDSSSQQLVGTDASAHGSGDGCKRIWMRVQAGVGWYAHKP